MAGAAIRVGRTDSLVRVDQREEREAERVLHPGAPELVELLPEDRDGVGHRLLGIPPQPDVEQVQPEGPLTLAHIEVDHVGAPVERHHAQRCLGEVPMRIDDDHRRRRPARASGPHEILRQTQEERGLAAPRFRHQQQVPAQQIVGKCHGDGPSLMRGHSDAAASGDGEREGQPLAGRGALKECHVGQTLGQVPETCQLAGIEDRERAGGDERPQRHETIRPRSDHARVEAVPGRQAELPVCSDQPMELVLDLHPTRFTGCEHGQSQLRAVRDAAHLLLDELHVVDRVPIEMTRQPQRGRDRGHDTGPAEPQLQPRTGAVPLVALEDERTGAHQPQHGEHTGVDGGPPRRGALRGERVLDGEAQVAFAPGIGGRVQDELGERAPAVGEITQGTQDPEDRVRLRRPIGGYLPVVEDANWQIAGRAEQ